MGARANSHSDIRLYASASFPTTSINNHERTKIMIKHLTICGTILALSSGCALSTPAQVGTGLVAGPEIDRQINEHILGGTPGYTITSDDAISRAEGSKWARDRCHIYNILYFYDLGFFAINGRNEGRDHCERWCMYEHSVESDCMTDNRYTAGEVVQYRDMHNQGEWIR